MKQAFLLTLITISLEVRASPVIITPFIHIDQFGYLCSSRKVAVIVDPQTGYNAADSYSPGTGVGQYQLRRWADDAVVFTGTLTVWNNGATQAQSGDKGWWFDFSSVTQQGSYYVYDLKTGSGSYKFDIGANVYSDVLIQACRMFYYQRCNFAKATPYADAKWTDGAAFEGTQQDRHARSRYDKNNAATAKDVSGGWFDAGDLNKYVPFTVEPLTQLMEIYRLHPSVFTENLHIPESGNGIPDILDEAKYEIDWLKKMQDATGTNGLLLKVGSDNYTLYTPPSTDVNNRYYVPECTSSTISGAVVFALAATIYRSLNIPVMTAYANDLQTRAVNAFARAQTTTSNFTSFQTDCDDQNIISGDADENAGWQKQCAITAAIYLYEATGSATYKNFVESNYNSVEPVGTGWWGPYRIFIQKALLRYTQLSGVSPSVVAAIKYSKQNTNTTMGLPEYNNATDLYRAYMPDAQYTWESNMPRSACGVTAHDYVHYGINTSSQTQYKEMAEQYLHWLHGVNPEGIVMLSNMYAYGADSSVNEIYNTWFWDGTIYDNAKKSARGPAPGFVTGGPNKEFTVLSLSPPANQPPQKAYKDWNTGWNGSLQESSYEISEPTIYCQAMYIELLAAIIDYGSANCVNQVADNSPPSAPPNLKVVATTAGAVSLDWDNSTDNVGVAGYDIFVNDVKTYSTTSTDLVADGLTASTTYSFRVQAHDQANNYSEFSSTVNGTTTAVTAGGALSYKYYQGSFTTLPNFSTLTPVQTGTSPNVDISVRPTGVDDNFAFLWEGYIMITTPGTYTFETNSDDGSKLYFNTAYSAGTSALVNNDGLHAATSVTGSVTIASAGTYPIAITFFEATGGQSMQVYWTGPGITRQLIPNSVFTSSGLNYKYYEGAFTTLPNFSALTPVKTGTSSNVDITVRNAGVDDNFAFEWDGYITLPTTGTYTFETISDDGSKLYFNTIYSTGAPALVNNDGLHAANSATGSVTMAAGTYPIAITFFEATGGESMQVYWTGPGITRQLIPNSAFTNTGTPPSNTAGLNYKYYEGAFTTLPNFSVLTPVKTGISANTDITVRNSGVNDNFAFLWDGYITLPATGTYTFETISDDGSKLYFNTTYSAGATALVNNDGLHAPNSASGSVTMAAGTYPIAISFFEATGGESMQVYWTGPGITRQLIPASAFTMTNAETSGVTESLKPGSQQQSADALTALNFVIKQVYPNPFDESFMISFINSSIANKISVDVFDASGRLLFNQNFGNVSVGSLTLKVDAGSKVRQPGVYFVRLQTNGVGSKIVKMVRK